MGKWLEGAQTVRQAMDRAGATLSDNEAVTMAAIFAPWATAAPYTEGDRVRYGGLLYRCLTAHTSQDAWVPGAAPSLWVRIDDPADAWPAWVQPLGATDAYPLGAQVSHKGKRWVSTQAANTWEPGVFGWDEQV